MEKQGAAAAALHSLFSSLDVSEKSRDETNTLRK